ncbi:PD-(D/E)XK motif protein [Dickeya zeae]|uniref:PD-(D/E)XK motif protein n=1 Tax=Dickeya zeae TaxID=204042 RepID=UPI0003A7C4E1|nr:PD-(D/E)XK motif protein [Dickeya zeae]
MAIRSEEQLAAAWRALNAGSQGSGWKVIDLFKFKNCLVKAGRKAGGNEESLLFGIRGTAIPSVLPYGQGFAFTHTELNSEEFEIAWFSLTRQQGGQIHLFSLMATDLIELLSRLGNDDGNRILTLLTARIRAWQEFMRRDTSGILSSEEEIGLIGELVVLSNLLADGIMAFNALDAWVGPLDGLHDFTIGTGAIEVKTTTLSSGFFANIRSLDQLDDNLYKPLYVGAVRIKPSDSGKTLPEFIDGVVAVLQSDSAASFFSTKLLAAGYIETHRIQYTRRFHETELTYRLVEDESPRLTRGNVAAAIHKVQYTLDLDAMPVAAETFNQISGVLGV